MADELMGVSYFWLLMVIPLVFTVLSFLRVHAGSVYPSDCVMGACFVSDHNFKGKFSYFIVIDFEVAYSLLWMHVVCFACRSVMFCLKRTNCS
jgi:hypothetical protein